MEGRSITRSPLMTSNLSNSFDHIPLGETRQELASPERFRSVLVTGALFYHPISSGLIGYLYLQVRRGRNLDFDGCVTPLAGQLNV
jgi:hypothetical protein